MRPVAALAVVVVLAGCASAPTPADTPAADTPAALPDTVYCHEVALPSSVLTAPVSASTLDAEITAGIEGTGMLDGALADWSVATIEPALEPTLVTLVRELAEPQDDGIGELRTHELVSFSTGPAAIASPTPWSLYRATSCDIRVGLGGLMGALGSASLTLDPDNLPTADDTTLRLFAWERACASGQPAGDRLEVLEIEETATSVRLLVGIREEGGACPSNPPTPFTVELAAPLGDRAIVDAAIVPARELAVPTDVPGWRD